MFKFKKFALLTLMVVSPSAFAEPYLLLGAAMGQVDMADVEKTYAPLPVQTDDSFGRAVIGVGANITPYVGIEAQYMTEAEVSATATAASQSTFKNSGFQFAVLGKAPLTQQLSLFGKLSTNYLEVKAETTAPGVTTSDKDSKFQLGYGLGVHYQVNDAVGLRLTAERIQIRDALNGQGDADQDQASLAVTFAF